MDYELPVVFIDSRKAADEISSNQVGKKLVIEPEDLERTLFFIVNKTQKGINPSLKDALLYRIKMGGIEGIPILRKESWRIHAAFIGITLNRDADSPLKDRINIGGKREQGKPIMLNSFVSSLERLFRDTDFSNLSDEERLRFIKAYWTALSKMLPEAFDLGTSKDYMVLKALGLYSLHCIAHDILKKDNGLRYDDEETLGKILDPLKSFDWTTQTSPLSTLGGMKGVNEAHRILLDVLNYESAEKPGSDRRLEDFLPSPTEE